MEFRKILLYGDAIRLKKVLTLLALLIITVSSVLAQRGSISGVITDKVTRETIVGANIIIREGGLRGTTSDFDGNFTLTNLTPGVYPIEISFISYNSQTLSVEVKPNQDTYISVELEDATVELETVTVTARKRMDNERVLLLEQRKATGITQMVGSQELSRKGVSDVSGAVSKVTGVSKQEGTSDIYVRGLGDRYNSTTLNGLPIPSNNPEEKNISLDLFTMDIVSYITIDKVYNNRIFGDFAGGNVDIASKRHTGDDLLAVEVGSGINLNAIDESSFPMQQGPNHFGFYTSSTPTTIAEFPFENSMVPVDKTPISNDFSIAGGKSFQVKGKNLSIFSTLGFNNGFASKDGIALSVNSGGYASKDFLLKSFDYTTNTTGLLNAGYDISRRSTLYYNLLFVNSTNQLTEDYQGTILDIANYNNGLLQRRTYERNTLIVNQLLGEHRVSDRTDFSWGVSYNTISSDMPDRIQNTFRGIDEGYLFGQNQITDNHRYFHFLQEQEFAASTSLDYGFGDNSDDEYRGKLSFGAFARYKSRNFNATQFNFRIKENMIVDPDNLDSYFNQENLERDYFTVETFRGNLYVPNALDPQVYSGVQFIPGALGAVEYSLTPKLTALVGLRLEYIFQEVSWNTQLDPRDRRDAIDEVEVLPNLTVRYALTEKQNLRFGASKTYTLPQFKERTLYIYEEVTQVKLGNPDLYASENYNVDLKWELFPSNGEIVSLTAYGKYILNPINEVTISSAASDISYLNTGDWGYVYGFEVEVRKEFFGEGRTKILAGFNTSYLFTEQELCSDKVSEETRFRVNFTHDKSAFSGASNLLANADITLVQDLRNDKNKLMATLAYRYSSDNIYSIGTNNGGNIVEKALHTLDFIVKADLTQKLSLGVSARNILDPKVERVQENLNEHITVLSYRRGTPVSLKLSYRF